MKIMNALGQIIITEREHEELVANYIRTQDHPWDWRPVVKLFTPDGVATWLLTEININDPDIAYGLCDLWHGAPEFGKVSISELLSLRGNFHLPIERDRHAVLDQPISFYIAEAQREGRVTI